MPAHVKLSESLDSLLSLQGNVVTHEQAVERGKTRHQVATLSGNGRWRKLYRGVYYTLPGEVPRLSRLWAAVLRVGHGGVLSHETAAEVWEITDARSDVIHVSVPRTAGRLPASEGIRLHYSSRLPRARASDVAGPPVTRAEETVLDLASESETAEDAITWALRACEGGTAAPDLITAAMAEPGHRLLRWREELRSALASLGAEVLPGSCGNGVTSSAGG